MGLYLLSQDLDEIVTRGGLKTDAKITKSIGL